eukprot:scaffold7443_cov82-Skeletonema_dohrnii-CCMP3373.AAC.1
MMQITNKSTSSSRARARAFLPPSTTTIRVLSMPPVTLSGRACSQEDIRSPIASKMLLLSALGS